MFFNVNGKYQQSLLHFQQKYVITVSNIWHIPRKRFMSGPVALTMAAGMVPGCGYGGERGFQRQAGGFAG